MKKYFKSKTFIIASAVFAISVLIGAGFVYINFQNNDKIVLAGIGDNTSGFAWSENIGWISFNSSDCDTDNNTYIDTDAMVLGCGGDNATTPTYDYGVDIDYPATSNFSGYAWSSNVGWISFQENSAPPDAYAFNTNCPGACDSSTNCTACYSLPDERAYGWAKILSLGDDGWIKMGDDSIGVWSGNGVSVASTTNDFSGWAWNSNGICVGGTNDLVDCDDDTGCPGGTCEYKTGIGWISFNCADSLTCSGGADDGEACNGSNCSGGTCVDTCAISNYKVHADIPPNPPTTLIATTIDCNTMRLNWTDNSMNETGFGAEYTNDGGLNWGPFCSVDPDIEQCVNAMPENTTYDFRVKALGAGDDSAWEPSSGGVTGATDWCPPVLTADTATANCDSIDLSWTFSGPATEYEVWRDKDNGGFTQVSSTSPPATNTYTDTDITSDSEYDYYVVAQPQDLTSNTVSNMQPCPSLPTWIEVKP